MALAGTAVWEVRTTGDDTNNGGGFDPGQTAGMFTDGAATVATGASPVFSSASYNFVAGDVNAWLYIASGTNWTPGWYQIVSVDGTTHAATLSAAAGAGFLKPTGTTGVSSAATSAAGCATVASPTGATWTIDYSQQAAAQFAYLDLASSGTGLTVSSSAKPFAKQQVGNAIVIISGTNFNAGRYVIASVAASVATVVGPTNITTGAGASGAGGLGGCLATPGIAGSVSQVSSICAFLQGGTFNISVNTANAAGGPYAPVNNSNVIIGYSTNRFFGNTDTRPICKNTATTISTFRSSGCVVNVECDGNGQTSAKPADATILFLFCIFKNYNTAPSSNAAFIACLSTLNSATILNSSGVTAYCEAYANTATGIASAGGAITDCISYGNTGASSDGLALPTPTSSVAIINRCIAYANGRDGVRGGGASGICMNVHCEANTGAGFNNVTRGLILIGVSQQGNGSSGISGAAMYIPGSVLSPSGTVFTSAAGNDFSLNNIAAQGALLRAAGYASFVKNQYPRATTLTYLDVGASQHADPPGFAGGVYGG